MLTEPKILLLDEPYTGLDQNSSLWLQEYLKKFHLQGGTVLMVTHQIELGLELATRILILKGKRIKYDFPKKEIKIQQCRDLLEK